MQGSYLPQSLDCYFVLAYNQYMMLITNLSALLEVKFLTELHHKHQVNLYGLCDEKGKQILVYKLIPKGNLVDHFLGECCYVVILANATLCLPYYVYKQVHLACINKHHNVPTLQTPHTRMVNAFILDQDLNT
jgi:hypothetical protein